MMNRIDPHPIAQHVWKHCRIFEALVFGSDSSCCHLSWRLLSVSMEGHASWCSCAPHKRVAGKCHLFFASQERRAGTAAIHSGSGCNCWVVTEEKQRRWQPWFKHWIFLRTRGEKCAEWIPLGRWRHKDIGWYLYLQALLVNLLAFCWWFKPLSVPT